MSFDGVGRIVDFGLPQAELDGIILEGSAFETSGCLGNDGKTACNRPYGNEKPGPDIRNFPFPPEESDIQKILSEIWQYD